MMRQTIFTFTTIITFALSAATLSSFAQKTREEFGKCGYYADSFQGRPTSNGEKYDKNALTCSHKSLPFGTRLRVTRLDNKKSVVVRVNDRGPYIEGYVVDVSGEAAKELDLLKAGTARVKLEVLETSESAAANENQATVNASGSTQLLVSHQEKKPAQPVTYNKEDPKPAVTAKGTANEEPVSSLYKVDIKKSEKTGFGIQISTLFDANNVLPIINKLQSQWPNKVLVSVTNDEANKLTTYKIIVGPFTDRKTAETQQKMVTKKGYKKTFVVDLSRNLSAGNYRGGTSIPLVPPLYRHFSLLQRDINCLRGKRSTAPARRRRVGVIESKPAVFKARHKIHFHSEEIDCVGFVHDDPDAVDLISIIIFLRQVESQNIGKA